jgi:DNA-binding HxlR family transcriptional regulator
MRKESSKNLENEIAIMQGCGMAYTLNLIGGRWKPSILWRLVGGTFRYSQLRASLPSISERILVLQLRELESDGLIERIVYREVPPRVEYSLTPLGQSLKPVLQSLSDWGDEHRKV